MNEVHGSARYESPYLTVTVMRSVKRRRKSGVTVEQVPNVSVYLVEDSRPDPRVAYPAFSLTKGRLEVAAQATATPDVVFVPSGEIWHVSVDRHGISCTCPHAVFSGGRLCKHGKSLMACGLIGKVK